MLTHYTGEAAAIANMLKHGFAWVPNRRGDLATRLLPQHDYSKREPQQFGMVSFTDLLSNETAKHQERFGSFGISVTDEWATRHHAQRVIYVQEGGPIEQALRAVFDVAYRDLAARIKYPEDRARLMAFEQKGVAAILGATLWPNMLTIWEYLEPETSSPQREWRIVNIFSEYSLPSSTKEVIAEVSPPIGWATAIRTLHFSPADVTALVCPAGKVKELRAVLPADYKNVNLFVMGDTISNQTVITSVKFWRRLKAAAEWLRARLNVRPKT